MFFFLRHSKFEEDLLTFVHENLDYDNKYCLIYILQIFAFILHVVYDWLSFVKLQFSQLLCVLHAVLGQNVFLRSYLFSPRMHSNLAHTNNISLTQNNTGIGCFCFPYKTERQLYFPPSDSETDPIDQSISNIKMN